MGQIRVAIIGVGNCASSLVQGLIYYGDIASNEPLVGLAHPSLGGYQAKDIVIVAAFDVNRRKVGFDLAQAIISSPNCTTLYCQVPKTGIIVQRGPELDGIGEYARQTIEIDKRMPVNVAEVLIKRRVDVVINYLPVGSKQATEFYAKSAIKARSAFVNCMPEPIASDIRWQRVFKRANLPILGDDIKSQLGATSIHRTLIELCNKRGGLVERTYQLNIGGNSDFLNMQEPSRFVSKQRSKMEAIQSLLSEEAAVTLGPNGYVGYLMDHKIAHMALEGKMFLGMRFSLDVKLTVEDSPNSAGVVVDAIRTAKLALDRSLGGPINRVSGWLFKLPPEPYPDELALKNFEDFVQEKPLE